MSHNKLQDLFEQAILLQKKGHFDDAIKIWRAIVTVRPDDVAALNNLGVALRKLGRIAESEAVLRTGLERAPISAELWMSLARTLSHWGVVDEALIALQKAEILAPDDPRPAFAMGRFQSENDNPMGAMASFQKAVDIDPNYAPALMALALGWKSRGQLGQATNLLRQAIKARPNTPSGHFHLAMALIADGQFEEGWREFEWRLAMDELQIIDPKIPRWEGEPLKGRRLLIRCELGLSETIQFSRLIKEIKTGETVFECPVGMRPLLAGSRIADEIVEKGSVLPKVDLWVPLLSLPAALKKNSANIQPASPYLRADPSRLAPWRKKLGQGISIGISWQGTEPMHEDRTRSVPLKAFAPLANLPNVSLVSLQKGVGRQVVSECNFPILDMTEDMDGGEGAFLDTAALMQSLTMVVSVDNAIAHLAGAFGRPVKVLVPDLMDWRWASSSSTSSPWYRGVVLYPKMEREWIDVVSECARDLHAYLDNR